MNYLHNTLWGSAGNSACSQETRVQSSSPMCWKERTRSHKYSSDCHTLDVVCVHASCMCTSHHLHYLLLYGSPHATLWSCSHHQAHVPHIPAPGPLDLCGSCHPSVPADGSCNFKSLGDRVSGLEVTCGHWPGVTY